MPDSTPSTVSPTLFRFMFLVTDGEGQYTYTCDASDLMVAIDDATYQCGSWARIELMDVRAWYGL